MNDEDLKALIEAEIQAAEDYVNTAVDHERARALQYYLGEPDGTEEEGHSQARSQDVEETIEWILPSIVDSFMIPEPVRFVPLDPADAPQARLETEACRYVLFKENDGFLNLYTWFKDALLQKNGILRVEPETRERVETRTLADVPPEGEAMLEQAGWEIAEREGNTITIRRTVSDPRIAIEPVPPEQFLVAEDWGSLNLDDCPFVAYWRDDVTRSELLEMGFDEEAVDEAINSGGIDASTSETYVQRRSSDGYVTAPVRRGATELDEARETTTLYECFVLYDGDGDGVVERHRVMYAGGVILSDEVVDEQPFVAITPTILSHRFWGRSVADQVIELQRIKTAILRQTLDNLYLANRPQKMVVEGAVNRADLKKPAIDRNIRVASKDAISFLVTPFVGGQSLQLLDYIDKSREMRTGVGPTFMGQSYELSTQTAHGVERMMSAAEQKVRLIARVFAEVGLRAVYKKIHRGLRKLGFNRLLELDGRWQQVDARAWVERDVLEAKVGLGHAARQQQAMALNSLLQIQTMLIQQGAQDVLVSMPGLYRTLIDYARAAGIERPEVYFTDPTQPEIQQLYQQRMMMTQQAQVAQVQALQMQSQLTMQKQQIDAQLKQAQLQLDYYKAQQDRAAEQVKLQAEISRLEAQRQSIEAKLQAEAERAARERARTEIEAEKAQIELAGKELEMRTKLAEREAQIEAERAQVEARIQQAQAIVRQQELKTQMAEIQLERSRLEIEKASSMEGGMEAGTVSEVKQAVQELEQTLETVRGPRVIEVGPDDMPKRIEYPDGSYREVLYDKDGNAVGLSELRGQANEAK